MTGVKLWLWVHLLVCTSTAGFTCIFQHHVIGNDFSQTTRNALELDFNCLFERGTNKLSWLKKEATLHESCTKHTEYSVIVLYYFFWFNIKTCVAFGAIDVLVLCFQNATSRQETIANDLLTKQIQSSSLTQDLGIRKHFRQRVQNSSQKNFDTVIANIQDGFLCRQ